MGIDLRPAHLGTRQVRRLGEGDSGQLITTYRDIDTIYRHLCDIRENFPGTPSERKVNLKDEAVSSRNASQALANGIGYDDRVQDAR